MSDFLLIGIYWEISKNKFTTLIMLFGEIGKMAGLPFWLYFTIALIGAGMLSLPEEKEQTKTN